MAVAAPAAFLVGRHPERLVLFASACHCLQRCAWGSCSCLRGLQLFLSMNGQRAFSEGEIIPIIFCEQVTALSDLSLLEAR